MEENLTRPDWTIDTSRSEKVFWLDKNENPDPILQKFLNNLVQEVKPFALNTYPETAKVYAKLAKRYSLSPRNFILTNGSDGAIRTMFDLFVSPGDTVIHTSPTFAMYSVYSKMFGAKVKEVEYQFKSTGPNLDFGNFLEMIKNVTPKLVCLPNPDSPTGTVISEEQMLELIKITEDAGSVLLIDEAYYPFYNQTVLPLVSKYPHLFVCRTFSKAWGAAGIRVGFLAGSAELMNYVHKNRPMYEVSTFSTEFINLLLDHEKEVNESVARLLEGKKYFIAELNKLGFNTTETFGNFFHVDFGEHQKAIQERLKDVVLYRVNFGGAKCMSNFSRFSLATKEQFEKILVEIRKAL